MKTRLIVGLATLFALGCGESGPVAGNVTLQLASPNTDGAVQFRVTATAPNTLTGVTAACSGCQIFQSQVNDTEIRGVVIGNISAGDLLSVGVSDTGAKSGYSGAIVAAAAPDYSLRSTGGYSLALKAN